MRLAVDDRHVLQLRNITVLDHEHSATDLDDVVDVQRVESTDLSLCAESEPRSVCRADVLEIEALLLSVTALAIINLCMEVAHLGIFLDVERVVHISPDTEAKVIDCNHSIP